MTDSTTPQDAAAMPPASDGSVAWGVVNAMGEVESIHWKWQEAVGMALIEGKVVPLYRSPTLTDVEREALDWACCGLECPDIEHDDNYDSDAAAILRNLMARLGGQE